MYLSFDTSTVYSRAMMQSIYLQLLCGAAGRYKLASLVQYVPLPVIGVRLRPPHTHYQPRQMLLSGCLCGLLRHPLLMCGLGLLACAGFPCICGRLLHPGVSYSGM